MIVLLPRKQTRCLMHSSGPDKRQCDSVGGRCCVLQGLEPNGLCGQRGERTPLHQAPGSDDPKEHPGHQEHVWDIVRQRRHQSGHAGTVLVLPVFYNIVRLSDSVLWFPPYVFDFFFFYSSSNSPSSLLFSFQDHFFKFSCSLFFFFVSFFWLSLSLSFSLSFSLSLSIYLS